MLEMQMKQRVLGAHAFLADPFPTIRTLQTQICLGGMAGEREGGEAGSPGLKTALLKSQTLDIYPPASSLLQLLSLFQFSPLVSQPKALSVWVLEAQSQYLLQAL